MNNTNKNSEKNTYIGTNIGYSDGQPFVSAASFDSIPLQFTKSKEDK